MVFSKDYFLQYLKRYKKNVIFFIVVISILVGGVILAMRYKNKKQNEPILLKHSRKITPLIIRNNTIQTSLNSGEIEFSYSFWINMDSVSGSENWHSNYYEDRIILKRGNTPVLYYNPESNTYKVGILTKIGEEEHIDLFEIKDIKLQKWNHWVISLNNRNLDIFINGRLRHSFITKNVPLETDDSFVVGSMRTRANGRICNIRFFNKSISKKRVRKLYNASKHKNPPSPSLLWWF